MANLSNLMYVVRVMLPQFVTKQKRLKERRGSWRSYLNLTVRFHKIGEDKYVKTSRDKNG